ncbi:MAG: hypothetical protein ACK5FE_08125 [Cyanobacteriota bacterium]|jgi:hypothetical protein
MSLALQSLVGLTLLVCGAAAVLPEFWQVREPRFRDVPDQVATQIPLRIVRAPADRWFLNGDPIGRTRLEELLQRQESVGVRFLPSSALSMAEVASSLSWLRSFRAGAVVLELPPKHP